MTIKQKNIALLERTRKKLHANPELSGQEFNTQQFIFDFLKEHCKTQLTKVGKTGIIAEFIGKTNGKNILIRGDIDALPIHEINTFSHQSNNKDISHKCGHDGHTTILLGLALKLTKKPIETGNILLLFQPSEENGKGAKAVLNDPYFSNLEIDFAFALHNLPGFPLHEIVIKEHEFTGHVKSIIIQLIGKTAHAAEPEKGYNPAMAIAKILHYTAERTNNYPESDDFFLITPIHVNMGEIAYGISPGEGEIHLTIRSWSTELMQSECDQLTRFTEQIGKIEKLKVKITWLEEFYSNNNHPNAVAIIKEATQSSGLTLNEITTPFKWGEDFGLFTQRYKGAMFGLGAGKNTPALHNPDYDFPDEITATGIELFYHILLKAQTS